MSVTLTKLLHNSWVLIAVGIGSAYYLMHFMCTGNIDYGVLFLAFGAVASVYSKNMVVILLMAMVATEMVRLSRRLAALKHWSFKSLSKSMYMREGLENNDSTDETAPEEDPATTASEPVLETKPEAKTIDTKKIDALQTRLDAIQKEIDAIKGTM